MFAFADTFSIPGIIRWISLICTAVTLGALTAHVLELPNKLRLGGMLWLAVQQELYSGWGRFIGPFELVAVVSTWMLLYVERRHRAAAGRAMLAACVLSAALLTFFILNAPVNAAFAAWTPATLPADWPDYRAQWELGHAISFLLVLLAFIVLLRSLFRDALARALRATARWPSAWPSPPSASETASPGSARDAHNRTPPRRGEPRARPLRRRNPDVNQG